MPKDDVNRLDDLAEKIEQAYQALQGLMTQINDISSIADTIETATKKINAKYLDILDPKKFEQLKDNSTRSMDDILKSIQKIEESIVSIDVLKQQTGEAIAALAGRISSYESNLRISKDTAREIDEKLLKIIKSAENAQVTGEKRILTASKLLEASAEVEKFDQLLKLENDNNRLLRDVLGKLSSLERRDSKSTDSKPDNRKKDEGVKSPFVPPKNPFNGQS